MQVSSQDGWRVWKGLFPDRGKYIHVPVRPRLPITIRWETPCFALERECPRFLEVNWSHTHSSMRNWGWLNVDRAPLKGCLLSANTSKSLNDKGMHASTNAVPLRSTRTGCIPTLATSYHRQTIPFQSRIGRSAIAVECWPFPVKKELRLEVWTAQNGSELAFHFPVMQLLSFPQPP